LCVFIPNDNKDRRINARKTPPIINIALNFLMEKKIKTINIKKGLIIIQIFKNKEAKRYLFFIKFRKNSDKNRKTILLSCPIHKSSKTGAKQRLSTKQKMKYLLLFSLRM